MDDHELHYHAPDWDEMHRKLEELDRMMRRERAGISGHSQRLVWFKPTLTWTKLRLLPPWSSKGHWFVEEGQHSRLPSNLNKPLPCGRSFVQSCMICDVVEAMRGRVPANDLKPFYPHRRYVFSCLVRGEETKGVQTYGLSETHMAKVWRQIAKPTVGNITDPVSGRDMVLTATGTGTYRRYDVELDDNPSPLIPGDIGNVKTNDILRNLPDLEAHLAAMWHALANTVEDAARQIHDMYTVPIPPRPIPDTTPTLVTGMPETATKTTGATAPDQPPVEHKTRSWKELLKESQGEEDSPAYEAAQDAAFAAGVGIEEFSEEFTALFAQGIWDRLRGSP